MSNNLTLDIANSSAETAERDWLDLSLAQQAVWLDAKLSGPSVYQLGGWARVATPFDEDAVRQSVSLIMARHDGLRLRVDDEMPRQWLDRSTDPPLTIVDLDGQSDPDEAFHAHVEKVFATEMPLGDHPLFRIELIRAGPNLNFLLWRFHHLIADAGSVLIAGTDWLNAYQALTSGTPQELAPQSSYLGTIKSDAAYLDSASYHQDLVYWMSRFDPLPPPLISDMKVQASAVRGVSATGWALEGEAFARFRESARAAGTSAQRALFALCAMVMGRRYGQWDVVSGMALHRRDAANRHVIGMMAGVIAVRCHFNSSCSLVEGVQEFSEQVDADLRHQRLPVDILSRALGASGIGRTGLFEVAMSYIPAERGPVWSGDEAAMITTGEVVSKEASPISIHAAELAAGNGLHVYVSVNTDFLDGAVAGTLASLFQSALEEFVREPNRRIEDLESILQSERVQVVEEWNQTQALFSQGRLEGLFSEQVCRTPDGLAVVGQDGVELSYAELEGRSTLLARHLVARGVRPGEVVGVRMERSTETIVALLAILKAGGVYLPLD
ncbi:MAG TPA: condensation domain-containing protein, partial [Acidobacteriaceae bacterium]